MNSYQTLQHAVFEIGTYPTEGTHTIGNGKVGAVGSGADLLQLFGPVYSAPTALSLTADPAEKLTIIQERLIHTDIWHMHLEGENRDPVGDMLDFTHPTEPLFYRVMHLTRPLTFTLHTDHIPLGQVFDNGADGPSLTVRIPDGSTVFMSCKTDCELFCRLLFPKGTSVSRDAEDAGRYTVIFPAGDSTLIFLAGEPGTTRVGSLPHCLALTETVRKLSPADVFTESLEDWRAYAGRVRDMGPLLKKVSSSRRAQVQEAIDSVSVALRAQMSREGGELAGSFYHLAYGRDMYGVIRGFLALGLYPEAQRCIDFFVRMYREKGWIPNANGMGMGCSHFHENDKVEQTGYLILELVHYAEATGQPDFIRDRLDYLCWLCEAQESQLASGMLPFNGDETYIAGGILPRDCIDHGSMEATALYITGVSQAMAWCASYGLLPDTYIKVRMEKIREAETRFVHNFIQPGDTGDSKTGDDERRLRVLCNQPRRLETAFLPPVRHGVCLGCGGFDWLRRTEEDGYLCPACWGKRPSAAGREAYSLDCALLMAGYVSSRLPDPALIRNAALAGYEGRAERPDTVNSVGYEYGLWLYVLSDPDAHISPALLEGMLDAVLAQRRSGGVWAEYYHGSLVNPASCPYRPWESAINLTGILRYLETKEKHDTEK